MKVMLGRSADRPGFAAGLAGTLVVHLATVALIWTTAKPLDVGPPVYAVELVAAPAPRPEAKPAPEAAPRPPAPDPVPSKPTPRPPKPAPVPAKPPRTTAAQTEPNPGTTPRTSPLPGEAPSTGNDAVTVSIPGLAFPYPDYLRNIVEQVYRRWERPRGTALVAEVSFLILRDGAVREIRLTRASGSFSFDLSAQGAIEAAGTSRAFGALPDGFPADVLPVSFYFTPRTQ